MSGNVDEETWWQHAACNGMDTSVFYPADRERGPTLARREKRAKQICHSCPVIADCLRWALDAREPHGVWGGKSAKERARILSAMTGRRASLAFTDPPHDRLEPQHVVRPA